MPNKFGQFKNIAYLCTRFLSTDPLAQLVEHNTFNVGVLGSSPKRITEKRLISLFFDTSWALTQGFFDLKVKASKLDDEPQADHRKEANKPLFLLHHNFFVSELGDL